MSNIKESVSLSNVFSIQAPKELLIERNKIKGAYVPEIDEHYVFRKDILSDALALDRFGRCYRLGDNSTTVDYSSILDVLYLTGPTGTGKSSVITQICARLNINLHRAAGHSRMEMPELVGHYTIMDGDTIWSDGPLTTAMRYGHVFLLDEIDLIDPSTIAGLNGVAEGAPLLLTDNGGELVRPHPDFRFIATGNTNGSGDRSGLYQGTLQQNAAFMDRTMIIKCDYPDPDLEMSILQSVNGLTDDIRKAFINIANDVRSQYVGDDDNRGTLDITLSTRTLLRWANLTQFFANKAASGINPALYALDRALGFRANPESAMAIKEIAQRYLS